MSVSIEIHFHTSSGKHIEYQLDYYSKNREITLYLLCHEITPLLEEFFIAVYCHIHCIFRDAIHLPVPGRKASHLSLHAFARHHLDGERIHQSGIKNNIAEM